VNKGETEASGLWHWVVVLARQAAYYIVCGPVRQPFVRVDYILPVREKEFSYRQHSLARFVGEGGNRVKGGGHAPPPPASWPENTTMTERTQEVGYLQSKNSVVCALNQSFICRDL
jgi:hypothetical protein